MNATYSTRYAAIKLQRAHTRRIKAGGIDVALAPFIVPAQRRGGRP